MKKVVSLVAGFGSVVLLVVGCAKVATNSSETREAQAPGATKEQGHVETQEPKRKASPELTKFVKSGVRKTELQCEGTFNDILKLMEIQKDSDFEKTVQLPSESPKKARQVVRIQYGKSVAVQTVFYDQHTGPLADVSVVRGGTLSRADGKISIQKDVGEKTLAFRVGQDCKVESLHVQEKWGREAGAVRESSLSTDLCASLADGSLGLKTQVKYTTAKVGGKVAELGYRHQILSGKVVKASFYKEVESDLRDLCKVLE